MTTRRGRGRSAALVTVALLCTSSQVAAQLGPPDRATSNGIFGRGGRSTDRQSLGLSGSLFGGWDSNVIAQLTNTRPREEGQQGPYFGGSAALTYRRPGDVNIGLSTRTGVSYYPTLNEATKPSYGVSGNVSTQLARRTGVSLAGSYRYSPRYSLAGDLFSSDVGDLEVPGLDDGLQDIQPVGLAVNSLYMVGAINQEISRRGSVSAAYRLGQTQFVDVDRQTHYQTGRLSYSHRLAQNLSARFGYAYTQSQHDVGGRRQTYSNGNLIASLDYNRGLSLNMSRSTILQFGFGTGVAQRRSVTDEVGDPQARLYLSGRVSLAHQMGRSWATQVTYSRGLRYTASFGQPILSSNLGASLSGLINQRVDFGAFTRVSFGEGVAFSNAGSFRTWQSTAQLRLALNRHMSIFSQVYHNLYDGGRSQLLFAGLVPNYFSRIGTRFGLSMFTSLLN